MTDERDFFGSNIVSSCHVETVVLLGREKVDGYILVDLDVEKLDGEGGTATYTEIKDYVKEKYGFSVSSLYSSDDRRNPHITYIIYWHAEENYMNGMISRFGWEVIYYEKTDSPSPGSGSDNNLPSGAKQGGHASPARKSEGNCRKRV